MAENSLFHNHGILRKCAAFYQNRYPVIQILPHSIDFDEKIEVVEQVEN